MNRSSQHLQSSILTGFLAVFGLTIGFANADGMLPSIAQSYVQMTQNSITEGPFAGAKFDIVGFMSHPCYEITGTETQSCDYTYGIKEPLSTYVQNGTLLAWLGDSALLPVRATSIENAASPEVSSATSVTATGSAIEPTVTMTAAPQGTTTIMDNSIDTYEEMDDLRTARSNKLWNICIRRDGGRDLAAICYQENIRLLMRLNVELTEDTVR